jgi:hypothetical protein
MVGQPIRRFSRQTCDNGAVKRVVFLLFLPPLAALSIGFGGYVHAGATTSPSSWFCTAQKPAVLASQRLKPELAGMGSQSATKTKRLLLASVSTVLKTLGSERTQLRSGPAEVRSAYKSDVSAARTFKRAVEHATTKSQIRAAGQGLAS